MIARRVQSLHTIWTANLVVCVIKERRTVGCSAGVVDLDRGERIEDYCGGAQLEVQRLRSGAQPHRCAKRLSNDKA